MLPHGSGFRAVHSNAYPSFRNFSHQTVEAFRIPPRMMNTESRVAASTSLNFAPLNAGSYGRVNKASAPAPQSTSIGNKAGLVRLTKRSCPHPRVTALEPELTMSALRTRVGLSNTLPQLARVRLVGLEKLVLSLRGVCASARLRACFQEKAG